MRIWFSKQHDAEDLLAERLKLNHLAVDLVETGRPSLLDEHDAVEVRQGLYRRAVTQNTAATQPRSRPAAMKIAA